MPFYVCTKIALVVHYCHKCKNQHFGKRKKFLHLSCWKIFAKKINNSHNLLDTVNSTSINLAEYTLSGHRGQGSTAEGGGKIDKTLFRGMKCLCLSLSLQLFALLTCSRVVSSIPLLSHAQWTDARENLNCNFFLS